MICYLMTPIEYTCDVFQAPAQIYTLTAAPLTDPVPDVYVNGLLMYQGLDYDLNGATLTFTGQDVQDMASVVVQVRYWKVAS